MSDIYTIEVYDEDGTLHEVWKNSSIVCLTGTLAECQNFSSSMS